MAAKYRKVDPRFWDDENVIGLDPLEKLVAVNAITSPQSNRCGLFKFSLVSAAEQVGMVPDSYAIAFGKVCNTLGWEYDKPRRVLYLPTWWKYNPPENPKHMKGCLADLHDLPQTDLLQRFANNKRFVPDSCSDTFRIAMGIAIGSGIGYQEQEQEQEQIAAAAAVSSQSEPKVPAKRRLARKPAPAPKSTYHSQLTNHFATGWERVHGAKYTHRGAMDGALFGKLLNLANGNFERARAVVDAYLADDSAFVRDTRRHALEDLPKNFNRYVAVQVKPVNDLEASLGLAPTRYELTPHEQDLLRRASEEDDTDNRQEVA